jgi:hypothetical protein
VAGCACTGTRAALIVAITTELLKEENLGRLRNELNCPAILVK